MNHKSIIKSPIIGYLYSSNPSSIGDLIVYCCTFNGNSLEGNFLTNLMGPNFSYFFFDSRGLGKNMSDYVALGLWESLDLSSILLYLN